MSTALRNLFIFAAFMLTAAASYGQRCATSQVEQNALLVNPNQRIEFEAWMKKKLGERMPRQSGSRTNATYLIPVVVHIIHNGEPVGSGANLPEAQVLSQIKVLNQDFQRLNADASSTPAEFLPVASGLDIQFILARQDPDGLPTNGIVRVKGPKTGYTYDSDNSSIKAMSYWPAEDYINIWVVNLVDVYLGYAQFPQTSLEGPHPPYDRLTDGVVIHNKAFGSADDGAFSLLARFNKGRTTSHEIGHFLGLMHTFGEGNGCSSTDYVADTPTQPVETETCPSAAITACGHHIMYQNFMDYTDDACMNMFTVGQMARVETVLMNSPRRVSLLTSHGALDPVTLTLDLEAKNVASPSAVTCGQSIVPKVVIRNRGTQAVTSARINFILNGSLKETKDFSFNLAQLETATLGFTTVNLAEPSNSSISFQIVQVNGGADNEPSNNSTSLIAQVVSRINPPYLEPFNSLPSNWIVLNPDNGTTWQNATAPKSSGTNKAMFIDLYNYQNIDAKDQVISPFFNVPSGNALLKFDRAYAMFPNVTTETFRVLVSVGCSADLTQAVEIYKRSGTSLATAANQTVAFVPTGESQWSSDAVSLDAYAGSTVRLIFESTNANGNNLYFDNVQLNTGELNDVRITSVVSPGPVFCNSRPRPIIRIQNLGTKTVNALNVLTELNSSVNAAQSFSGLALTPGASADLTLEELRLVQANNTIKVTITNPEVVSDDTPSNNALVFTRILNDATEKIPLRQNFDENISNWTIFSEVNNKSWQGTKTATYANSLVFKSFSPSTTGEESWFVSPVIDMTKASEGSLLFNTSYAKRTTGNERLRVLVSEDCGETYANVLFDRAGSDLSNKSSDAEWTPSAGTEWSDQYISLNELAGKDKLRFAFVATNDNGNNLYLDNIEFFVEDNPNPPRISDFYSIYNSETNPYEFFIVFNLSQKQSAHLVVYNTLGQELINNQLPESLNQTYTVNLFGQSAGIYVVKLQAGTRTATAKLFVGR